MNVPEVSIRKILYTTDLSETGRHAFAYAGSLSKLYGAKLSVMHVVDEEPELDRRLVGYMSKDLWEEIKNQNVEEAKEMLFARKRDDTIAVDDCIDQYCAEIRVGSKEDPAIRYGIVVKLGDPVKEIVKYAAEGEYDLIIVGRHGHSILHDAVHRSAVRSIIAATNIPVLVIQLPD